MKPQNLGRLIFCMLVGLGFLGESVYASSLYPYKDVGDGKSATQVTLTLVDCLAADREGNVYLAHRSKNRIRKITPDGVITTVVGNGNIGWMRDGLEVRITVHNFPDSVSLDNRLQTNKFSKGKK